jgi:hypothetical protein
MKEIKTIYRLLEAVAASNKLEEVRANNSSYVFSKTALLGAEMRAENALNNLAMHDQWGF